MLLQRASSYKDLWASVAWAIEGKNTNTHGRCIK